MNKRELENEIIRLRREIDQITSKEGEVMQACRVLDDYDVYEEADKLSEIAGVERW